MLSFDSDEFRRRQLLPDKCPFEAGIDAFWRFQLFCFPRAMENRSDEETLVLSVELREQRSGKNKRIEWRWATYRCGAGRFLEGQASRSTLGSLLESIVASGISM